MRKKKQETKMVFLDEFCKSKIRYHRLNLHAVFCFDFCTRTLSVYFDHTVDFSHEPETGEKSDCA